LTGGGVQVLLNRLLIKLKCLPFHYFQGILWTFAQACAEAVAVLIRNYARFAVHHLDGTFGA
jgi:hypothetical protein